MTDERWPQKVQHESKQVKISLHLCSRFPPEIRMLSWTTSDLLLASPPSILPPLPSHRCVEKRIWLRCSSRERHRLLSTHSVWIGYDPRVREAGREQVRKSWGFEGDEGLTDSAAPAVLPYSHAWGSSRTACQCKTGSERAARLLPTGQLYGEENESALETLS